MNKKELVLLLKEGDDMAYTCLVNLYSRKLFAYAISLSGDYSLAKDIVQEVFLKTFEHRDKLNPNYSIDGFLYRSTYNQFINTYHKNKSLLKVHDDYVKYLNQIIEDDNNSDFDQRILKITKCIEKLPKKCKEIFLLSKRDGLTNQEISEILKISIKTVESQITIAFKQLRKQII
ncbi:MAG: RNA polymerase sigma factor [Flavobacteriaceae bacterium]